MNEKQLNEIKEKANEIIGSVSLDVLADEEKLLERLINLDKENTEYMDFNLISKTLDYIKEYLEIKKKLEVEKNDYNFLTELAKELREQNVRGTDAVMYVPIFKIVSNEGKEKIFLIRKNATEFQKVNSKMFPYKTIKIEETDNTDLSKIIEIIMRNF